MRHRNKLRTVKVVLAILILLMFASSAYAIGIAPSAKNLKFEPRQKITYTIDIVNNGHEDLDVMLYPRGEFEKNVKLSTQSFRLSKQDQMRQVDVEFTMPASVDTAGEHVLEIVAVGMTPSQEGEGTVVKADIAVVSKLTIEVPYPEKYAEARLYVLDTELGKKAKFNVPVFNKGTQDIEQVGAEITVYSSDGAVVDTLKTETQRIKTGENTKFLAEATKDYTSGQYRAVARVDYDHRQTEATVEFTVGELEVQIRSLVVDSFSLGQVAKFDILLYNTWSMELKGVYAEMEITDSDNKRYTEFKTVATDLQPKALGRLEGYWYTQGVAPGIYIAKITLHYANRVSQKIFELEVYPNRIVARELLSGGAISQGEELNLQKNAYLILIILAMAGVIAALVVKLRGRGRQPGAQQPPGQPAQQPPTTPQAPQAPTTTPQLSESAQSPSSTAEATT